MRTVASCPPRRRLPVLTLTLLPLPLLPWWNKEDEEEGTYRSFVFSAFCPWGLPLLACPEGGSPAVVMSAGVSSAVWTQRLMT